MSRVNTKQRILEAALKLFVEDGFQKTSIARIELEAGLAPRAGAFYRHFDSKSALLGEVARTYVSETPEDFGLDRLADYGDTRAELVTIALKYEEAAVRQRPYARLIEEVRLLDVGADLQQALDRDMMAGLLGWLKQKPAAEGLSPKQLTALLFNVFGAWLYYLSMAGRESAVKPLRETLLNDWASRWAAVLDEPAGPVES